MEGRRRLGPRTQPMSRRFPYRLRSERKRAGLTQDELAYLIGLGAASGISRLEKGEREPEFRTALAYEIIFDRTARELFSAAYQETERLVVERASTIAERMRQIEESNRIAYKLKRLEELIARCRRG
jgi:transcriptional regulator with XRE-family HTH domain